ncbi:hypothetical protein [Ensifer sp. ENS11]|uniref:hypothetical protein n=2 Tax=Sinorhizobium/Ensifer group TaxID=227292 RepID=UPI002782D45E|nr:hypothetical protein [Ensifer adhaerens]
MMLRNPLPIRRRDNPSTGNTPAWAKYPDFDILWDHSGCVLREASMKTKARDRELIDVMRRYFAAKAELSELRAQLEQARRAAGADIGSFYDPRTNTSHADDVMRSHALNSEMRSLMDRAEAWGRQEIATLRRDLPAEELQSEPDPTDEPAASGIE